MAHLLQRMEQITHVFSSMGEIQDAHGIAAMQINKAL
jgi:hypothetical protein